MGGVHPRREPVMDRSEGGTGVGLELLASSQKFQKGDAELVRCAAQVLSAEPDNPDVVPWTHTVEGKNQLSQVVCPGTRTQCF